MVTRSRAVFTTLVGLSLAGLCLGSARAQSGMGTMKSKSMKQDRMMTNDQGMMHDGMMRDDMMMDGMMDPAPLDYPFAAPGTLHLYHYTDYSHRQIAEQSYYMQKMDDMHHEAAMLRDRMMAREKTMGNDSSMMHDGYMWMDDNGMMMNGMMMKDGVMSSGMMADPAPINYPFAAPGSLHLYHWVDYTQKRMAEQSSAMQKMDDAHMQDKMMRNRMMMREGYMRTDDNDMTMDDQMLDPAPLGYPFAAPGSLHLYHYTDYTGKHIAEQSPTMQKMDDAHMQDKRRMDRMNTPKAK